MLVSVIISNYNYSLYIEAAIGSLVNQTHKNLELIIVDDGSTDGSIDLIKSLKEVFKKRFARFEVIHFKKNCGKLAAINKAVPLVRGEFITILDADDIFHQNYISYTSRILEKKALVNKNLSLAYTDCFLIDSGENIIGNGKSRIFNKKLILNSSYIPGCAMMTAEALKKNSPFNERIRIGTKHHMWKKIINAGGIGIYIGKPLFYYRMHDKNISGIGEKISLSESGFYNLYKYWPLSVISKAG